MYELSRNRGRYAVTHRPASRPKLAPRQGEMEARLADATGAPVSVKGRRAEGLGAIGRGEGIACWAVALVART